MKRIVLSAIALSALCIVPFLHSQTQNSSNAASEPPLPSMPSTEEINDLLSKASEYAAEYRMTFKNAKPTLDKTPTPGFVEKSDELCSQANAIIAAIKKNGPTAYALVTLVGVLDDMSLNGARASAMSMIVALQQGAPEANRHALEDVQDLAQVEKNCYDISELILHSTLRLIAVEEQVLHVLTDQKK
jgi:hypothetical protein